MAESSQDMVESPRAPDGLEEDSAVGVEWPSPSPGSLHREMEVGANENDEDDDEDNDNDNEDNDNDDEYNKKQVDGAVGRSGRLEEAPPRSLLSTLQSMERLTPTSTNGTEADDLVVFSDSDGASQNSFDMPGVRDPAMEVARPRLKGRNTSAATARIARMGDMLVSEESTPSPRPKKRLRRKSNRTETSEKSHRSLGRHPEQIPTGGGYTLAPATGKVFRNLLILEDSLREQVIQQRALRRKYLTFLAVLCSSIAAIAHKLHFEIDRPDTTLRVILQFTLLALVVTLMLYHLSGEYQKTIVLPRKFLSSTNKGLRQLNVRLVKIKTPMSDTMIDLIREFLLYTATLGLTLLHKASPATKGDKTSKLEVLLTSCQLQCQPRTGVTDVKLILNPRMFNTDVREGWELYRSEFWAHEGVRRRRNIMTFVNESHNEDILDRNKLLRKDRRERRDRRKSLNHTSSQ